MKLPAILLLALSGVGRAQAQVDPALAAVIQSTRAIDNHAHPLRYVAEGEKRDDEYDALPCDTLEQAPGPLRTAPITRNGSKRGARSMGMRSKTRRPNI